VSRKDASETGLVACSSKAAIVVIECSRMYDLDLSADELSSALLELAGTRNVCILDSCGVGHLGSHLMIAGVVPADLFEIRESDPSVALVRLEESLLGDKAAIFSVSYDLGAKLEGIAAPETGSTARGEPDIFVALFDAIAVHDYDLGKTFITGEPDTCRDLKNLLAAARLPPDGRVAAANAEANFTREEYIEAVERIQELIRDGVTYQTNLTQQIRVTLTEDMCPETVFRGLRRDHPAPFAAFLKRLDSTVVSASPERFFRIDGRAISASPIKGTRPRGETPGKDAELRTQLRSSEKDLAENTMIVDLLRNDLGRVCEFGSVEVGRLCELEEHPTLFHLVSTINGRLRDEVSFSDVMRALFPCGSITGAPKISTMQVINEVESKPRGLSMGAIGYHIPEVGFDGLAPVTDTSVAIRTMVFSGGEAVFNVGGGIVTDSDPESEYQESLLKARALLTALGATLQEQEAVP
jgi:para-aminobenzoate synthetase component I